MMGCGTPIYQNLEKGSPIPGCITKFRPEFTSELYHAAVNVTGKHLSGLLFFKTMNDSTQRVVFTSETGLTFFDFEYAGDSFRVVNILNKMDRKPVINALRKDIGLVMMKGIRMNGDVVKKTGYERYEGFYIGKETNWYVTDTMCATLKRIEVASKRKKKIIVHLTGTDAGLPDSVYIDHRQFEFNISLKKVER